MQIPKQATLLRIFVGEDDRHGHQPLYQAIVLKAREMHLAGATVLRGPMGYGHSSRLHTTKILRLSEDLPVVVEIIDSEERINGFLPVLDGMMTSGLVTLERVEVLQYGNRAGRRRREGMMDLTRIPVGVAPPRTSMSSSRCRAAVTRSNTRSTRSPARSLSIGSCIPQCSIPAITGLYRIRWPRTVIRSTR